MATVASAAESSSVRTLEDLQTRTVKKTLGQEDFLQILVAQMSNQDPLSPTSDTEFIAQLAQFTQLEQMQTLSADFAASQAYSMIGKYVYIDDGTEKLIFGKVDGVVKEDGINYLLVGGEAYEASKVAGVVNAEDNSEEILRSAELVGKTITATYIDEADKEVTVSGVVEKILIDTGVIYAVVDGQNVPIAGITQIANS